MHVQIANSMGIQSEKVDGLPTYSSEFIRGGDYLLSKVINAVVNFIQFIFKSSLQHKTQYEHNERGEKMQMAVEQIVYGKRLTGLTKESRYGTA